MKHKIKAKQHVIHFIKLILIQHNCKFKIVRIDNGPKFKIPSFYVSHGINHQTCCVESHKNGYVKRKHQKNLKHQKILNTGIDLHFRSNLPKTYFSYVVSRHAYIMNKTPRPFLENKSPYLIMHKKIQTLMNLKVFGSLDFVSTLQAHITKLAPKESKCVFLGYKAGMKGKKTSRYQQ